MFHVESPASPYNRPTMAKTPPPIAAPKIGTAVAGARPPEELEDAAEPLADAAELVPVWWPLAVALWTDWERLESFDMREVSAAPVAVANASEIECFAMLWAVKTLASALLIWLLSEVCAANAEARTALLCAAWDAAAPDSVWPARSEEMMAAARLAAAALAVLAAAAIEAA